MVEKNLKTKIKYKYVGVDAHIDPNNEKQKGITLIALIITIIILLILAGVTISLTIGENGLLKIAQNSTTTYKISQIKEKVEIAILDLDAKKIVNGENLTIEQALIGIQEKEIFEEIDLEEQTGIVDGYVIELGYDIYGKVVIKDMQKDVGIRLKITTNPKGYTNGKVEITIEAKTNGETVTNLIVSNGMTKKEDGKYEIEKNGTYKITATLSSGEVLEKEIEIAAIDKLAPKDFTLSVQNTENGLNIVAITQDAEATEESVQSGIEKYEYYIKKSDVTEYIKYETNVIEEIEIGTYNIYVIAYDKAGNYVQTETMQCVFYGTGFAWEKWDVKDSEPVYDGTTSRIQRPNISFGNVYRGISYDEESGEITLTDRVTMGGILYNIRRVYGFG